MFLILSMEDGMNACRRSRIEQDELTVGRGSDEISQAFPRPFQFLFIIYDRKLGKAESLLELFAFRIEDMRKSGFLQRDGLQKRRCGAAFVDIAAGDDGHSHILSPFFPLPYIMSKKGMCVGKSAFRNGLKRIQNMKHLLQLLRLHLIREASFVNAVLKIPDLFGVGICLRQIDVPRVVL